MTRNKQADSIPQPSKAEVSEQALAWAEYLYDEYVSSKHKQLLLTERDTTIKKRTNEGTS